MDNPRYWIIKHSSKPLRLQYKSGIKGIFQVITEELTEIRVQDFEEIDWQKAEQLEEHGVFALVKSLALLELRGIEVKS